MLAGIKNILIIVNKGQLQQFKKILPEKNNLGIQIKYKEQEKPKGLPEAFIIGEKFIGEDNVALILGDNFFYGQSLTQNLKKNSNFKQGAKIFLHQVKDSSSYGVALLNRKNKILKIIEKPKKEISNLAITGLYFFDKKVVNFKLNHLKSSNVTYLDKDFEEKKKTFNDYDSYKKYLNKIGIIVDQEKRKDLIKKNIEKILIQKNLKTQDNEKLLEEVTNLIDYPYILECSF